MLRSCGLFQWLNPKNIDRLFSLKYEKGEGGNVQKFEWGFSSEKASR